ncbi:unnamed protein product [Vitrella brassicaformis CCMP3155]|uniref:Uncharacterized protein n=1 Tax=Vitrella brassicaformis (strain CCMP3155) TaxID=1169540 RepID=A0A0G4EDJ5_VITBC|nr:unnamed protein product [Vitrella brassicaformis CCMP3155]|eukprot:CEL93431.1 unnamed protein product [Vitrella brassicaformis CCMP3155]
MGGHMAGAGQRKRRDSFLINVNDPDGVEKAKQEAIACRQAMERLHYTFVGKGEELEQPAGDNTILQMTAGLTNAVSYLATPTVAAGATVDVTVEVDAVTAGQYGATLDIQSGGSGVTSSLRLLALGGSSLSPALPASLSVGKSAVHVPSPAVEVPIANSGPGVLAVQVQDVTGDHANDFEVLPPKGMIVTVSPKGQTYHTQ